MNKKSIAMSVPLFFGRRDDCGCIAGKGKNVRSQKGFGPPSRAKYKNSFYSHIPRYSNGKIEAHSYSDIPRIVSQETAEYPQSRSLFRENIAFPDRDPSLLRGMTRTGGAGNSGRSFSDLFFPRVHWRALVHARCVRRIALARIHIGAALLPS